MIEKKGLKKVLQKRLLVDALGVPEGAFFICREVEVRIRSE